LVNIQLTCIQPAHKNTRKPAKRVAKNSMGTVHLPAGPSPKYGTHKLKVQEKDKSTKQHYCDSTASKAYHNVSAKAKCNDAIPAAVSFASTKVALAGSAFVANFTIRRTLQGNMAVQQRQGCGAKEIASPRQTHRERTVEHT
jgi:hypothetical protein